MKPVHSSSVVIVPGTVEKPQLEDVIQALHHVESIMAINNDDTIEPGHLGGMSLMLGNAEKLLTEMRSALPAMARPRRPPTPGSTAWPGIDPALTLPA